MKKIKVCLIFAKESADPGNLPHLDSTLRFSRRNFANLRGKFRNFTFPEIWRKLYMNIFGRGGGGLNNCQLCQ